MSLVNDDEKSIAVREVAIKKGDRCFCVWHCDCVCLCKFTLLATLNRITLLRCRNSKYTYNGAEAAVCLLVDFQLYALENKVENLLCARRRASCSLIENSIAGEAQRFSLPNAYLTKLTQSSA